VALVALAELVSADGLAGRLIDVQWATPHLRTLGIVDVSRVEYLARLRSALSLPLPAVFSP
jgi:leucyl/phenylalanyl-tRNA--protein transferase